MKFSINKLEGLLILYLDEKRLDAKLSVTFKEKLKEIIDEGNKNIILNIEQIKFIDSSGLGSIVSSYKQLGRDGKFYISNVSEMAFKTFKLTRMDKIFKIFSTENEAIEAMKKEI